MIFGHLKELFLPPFSFDEGHSAMDFSIERQLSKWPFNPPPSVMWALCGTLWHLHFHYEGHIAEEPWKEFFIN